MSTQWNRQLNRYVSKVMECLEQNIRKQIDCKRPSNIKQMNRLQNIQIEIWKYKAVICTSITLNYIKEGIFCKSSYKIYQPIEIFYFMHGLLWKRNLRSCLIVSIMQVLAATIYKAEKLVSKFINFFLDSFGKLAPLLVECCLVKK